MKTPISKYILDLLKNRISFRQSEVARDDEPAESLLADADPEQKFLAAYLNRHPQYELTILGGVPGLDDWHFRFSNWKPGHALSFHLRLCPQLIIQRNATPKNRHYSVEFLFAVTRHLANSDMNEVLLRVVFDLDDHRFHARTSEHLKPQKQSPGHLILRWTGTESGHTLDGFLDAIDHFLLREIDQIAARNGVGR